MSGRIDKFHDSGCEVLGISTDSLDTHRRWLTTSPDEGGLGPIGFPLASDEDGEVCQRYGVYVERQRVALRGLFIIDPNAVLQYQAIHGLSVGRSTDEVLRVLDALQSGGLCPAERAIGEQTIDVGATLAPGRVIGQYRVAAELGAGAFGTVFKATDELLERTVALKVLRTDGSESNESLLAEARAAAALNHPNVCMVHNVDTSNGASMIVMEYVHGRPLSDRLQSGPVDMKSATRLIRQIAAGMASAHQAGVVHGDLKPGNLMVTPDDSVKIMDFGLARRITPSIGETVLVDSTSDSGLAGTPGYMAPEQTRGEPATPDSDVFALGLIFCEMLTGRAVVSGRNIMEILRSIEQLEIPSEVADFPEPVGHIVRETLHKDPQHRTSMADIASELGSV